MTYKTPFFLMFLCCFLFYASPSNATIAGDTCTQASFGSSQLDSDGVNIIVCLKTKANATSYQWKSMSGGSTATGTIAFFALSACPDGWATADGSNGTVDVRGYFIRALDLGAGRDETASRTLASTESDAIRNITGNFMMVADSAGRLQIRSASGAMSVASSTTTYSMDYNGTSRASSLLSFDASLQVPTGTENRPKNIALLACEKM